MVRVLAVIPARGGSKGIPRKNLQPLAGQPLLVHTLEAARQAKTLDQVLVSTDDEEIARVARAQGVEVIARPPELARDESPTEDALLHALDVLKARDGYEPEIVVTLEPTSPLRTAQLIDRCVAELVAGDADAELTVVETRDCFGRVVDGTFQYLVNNQPRRRQDREPLYRESGAVYATRTDSLRKFRSVVGGVVRPVIISAEEALDINTLSDLSLAESLMRSRREAVAP